MEKLLLFFKGLVPPPVFQALVGPYHFALACFAHVFYRMPSRKMVVIGVTGTKGKTTTANLLADILNASGKKTGVTSSTCFGFGEERRVNDTKQGMPGRFRLQKLLAEMVRRGCTHAVIETTSEGMLQHRHRFIYYDAVVFTNLSPEHIERHGSFARYRETKVRLFAKVSRKRNGIGVYNLDDENAEYFLAPNVSIKIGYTLKNKSQALNPKFQINSKLQIQNIKLDEYGSEFDVEGVCFEMPLVGEFNVYNAGAAVATAFALGASLEQCAEALRQPALVSGRFEVVQRQPFVVIVDYAHEPKSLEASLKATTIFLQEGGRIICLLGSQGGGRDRWKRPAMGKVAARHADEIVLTNEDPYNENPGQIIDDIKQGISEVRPLEFVHKIVDRREAIKKAISLAKPGDAVLLTGKGGEVWMVVEKGKRISWDEVEIVKQELNNGTV